jgi:hypothetical protein
MAMKNTRIIVPCAGFEVVILKLVRLYVPTYTYLLLHSYETHILTRNMETRGPEVLDAVSGPYTSFANFRVSFFPFAKEIFLHN